MQETAVLFGVVMLLVGFILNYVLAPLIPKSKNVTVEVCQQCQRTHAAERDGVHQQLEVMNAELVRMRTAIHELRNGVHAALIAKDMREAGISLPSLGG